MPTAMQQTDAATKRIWQACYDLQRTGRLSVDQSALADATGMRRRAVLNRCGFLVRHKRMRKLPGGFSVMTQL